jgi:adenylosuccinate synthase
MQTAYIIVDLGYGDAGKGSVVDYLAHARGASGIVRYTGGPHAAHHVVRADGASHAFCQFGATFKPGVRSHLARGVIVKPENLLYEGQTLEEKGISRPFARLSINPGCRLVTSYHAMLCQMKEVARGDRRRGTVGIGVGEAVIESEETPDLALRVIDLYEPVTLRQKLCAHYENKQRQARAILRDCARSPYQAELRAIYDSFISQVRLEDVLALYRRFSEGLPVSICSDRSFMESTRCGEIPGGNSGDIIFEGAHAALLDRDHGYYPYVAKTDTTTNEALRILEQSGFAGEAVTLGVVRALGYRHGPGPFVTEDLGLRGLFSERHNRANEWQGGVRYGWFDLLAIRHGAQLNLRVDGLALTMLDQLSRLDGFQVCLSYEYVGRDYQRLEEYFEYNTTRAGRVKVTGIKPVPTHRTDALASLLFDCIPWNWLRFDRKTAREEDFIRFLESPEGMGLPVRIISTGPTAADKQEREPVLAAG